MMITAHLVFYETAGQRKARENTGPPFRQLPHHKCLIECQVQDDTRLTHGISDVTILAVRVCRSSCCIDVTRYKPLYNKRI